MAADRGAAPTDARIPVEVRDALARLTSGAVPRADAAATLAAIAHRVTNDLHRVARAEAGARRDLPEWGAWAALANAARDAVLKMAAIRRTANEATGASTPPTEGEGLADGQP
jgi:predicted Fe-S protein YdhL (DUF1289 family)